MENKNNTSALKKILGFGAVVVLIILIASGGPGKIFGDSEKRVTEPTQRETSAHSSKQETQEEPVVTGVSFTDPEKHGSTNVYLHVQTSRFLHSFDSLTNEKQRAIYRAIEHVAGSITDQKDEHAYDTEPFELTGSYILKSADDYDMRAAYVAFKEDNPQVFWLNTYRLSSFDRKTVVYMKSLYSAAETEKMKMQISADIAAFFGRLDSSMSAYEKEKAIHDYLIEICTYNKEIESALSDPEKREEIYYRKPMLSTAYGALHDREAVCAGYSRAFQLLCQCAGLDCVCINGFARNEGEYDIVNDGHAWNAAKLSGDWYMIDTTWDDNDDDFYKYFYFNLTSSQIRMNHMMNTWETDSDGVLKWNTNLYLPNCIAETYNYYAFDSNCLTVTDPGDDQIVSELMKAVNAGRDHVTLYLDPNQLSFDQAYEALLDRGEDSYMQRYFYAVLDRTGYQQFSYRHWAEGSRNAVFIRFSLSY